MTRPLSLAGAAILLASALQGQFNPLPYRPVDADFSSALDRIVMVSVDPHQLNIYDPVANTSQNIALTKAPLSLSLSPNGLYAAVGHDKLISYVNLSTRAVEKTFTVTYAVNKLALGAAHIYVPPFTINIAAGAATSIGGSVPNGYEQMRVHPSGEMLIAWYGSNTFVFSLVAGELSPPRQYYTHSTCTGSLLSEDGGRIYSGCIAFQLPLAQDSLGAYRGKFSALPYFFAGPILDESAAVQRLAVVGFAPEPQPAHPVIQLYDTRYFQDAGRFQIPKYVVNSVTYDAWAQWIFFAKDGSAIYTVLRADPVTGLLHNTAVATIHLPPSATPCPVTLSKSSLNVPASGAAAALTIAADSTCVYRASSSAPWIEALAYGAGLNTLRITVRRNTGPSRTGTVTLGDKTLNISQSAPAAPSTMSRLTYPVTAWEYSRSLDRMILLGQNRPELLIFDPASNTEQPVALPLTGATLSLSPDGKLAVVGHDGWISYIDLTKSRLESTWEAGVETPNPAINGNGYVYWGAPSSSDSSSVPSYRNLQTGVTTFGALGSRPLLPHPAGKYFYTLGSTRKLDSTTTPPTWKRHSSLTSDLLCAPTWFSEDGARLFTDCGTVRRLTEGPDDLQENGSLGAIRWASNSSARAATAVIASSVDSNADTEVQVYADQGLLLKERYPIPWLLLDGESFPTHGRGVFWNAAADRIYALVEGGATTSSNREFAVATVTPGSSPVCTVTLSATSAAFSAGGGTGEFRIDTGTNCYWTLTPIADFAYADVRSGIGPRTILYTVLANPGSTARAGQFNVSGKAFSLTQSGLSTAYVSGPQSFAAGGGTGTFKVTAVAGYQWNAASNAPWIVLTQGFHGTGSGSVSFSVLPNTAARRTGTITIAGQTATVVQQGITTPGYSFKPMVPCRLMDTRAEYNFEGRTGAFGPPILTSGETRTLDVRESRTCNIPDSAKALFLNITLVPNAPVDFASIAVYGRNNIWTVRSPSGLVVANSAIAILQFRTFQVYTSNTTHMVIDVSGYFTDDPFESNLVYYPMTPCRVVDTRAVYRPGTGPFGPPSLAGGASRRFAFPQSPHCSIPSNAAAYSVTMTVVPHGPLAYLTAWPAGSPQPNVSSMNSPASRILANSVIIPAGDQGAIDLFAYSATDVLIDINGYFAPDDGRTGLYFFPRYSCRVVDTTDDGFGTVFGPLALGAETSRTFPIGSSQCGLSLPSSVKAYAINMTALPNGSPLPFLTAYPTGAPRPNASQLNAFEGDAVSNSAIVPAGTNRSIDIFAYRATHLVVELNGYFGR